MSTNIPNERSAKLCTDTDFGTPIHIGRLEKASMSEVAHTVRLCPSQIGGALADRPSREGGDHARSSRS